MPVGRIAPALGGCLNEESCLRLEVLRGVLRLGEVPWPRGMLWPGSTSAVGDDALTREGVPLGKCALDGDCVLTGKAGGGAGNVPRRRVAPRSCGMLQLGGVLRLGRLPEQPQAL